MGLRPHVGSGIKPTGKGLGLHLGGSARHTDPVAQAASFAHHVEHKVMGKHDAFLYHFHQREHAFDFAAIIHKVHGYHPKVFSHKYKQNFVVMHIPAFSKSVKGVRKAIKL
jgi:hypothetical protein